MYVQKIKIISADNHEILVKAANLYQFEPKRVTKNDIYVMWLMLQKIDLHIVKTYKKELLEDLKEIFKIMKNMPDGEDEKSFIDFIDKIIEKYQKLSGKNIGTNQLL